MRRKRTFHLMVLSPLLLLLITSPMTLAAGRTDVLRAVTPGPGGTIFGVTQTGVVERLTQNGQPAVLTTLPGHTRDITTDVEGRPVVLTSTVEAVASAGTRILQHVAVLDVTGALVRSVPLPDDVWAKRIVRFAHGFAVAGPTRGAGYQIALLNENLEVISRIPVDLPCESLGELSLASDGTTLWIAPREQCGDGYVVVGVRDDGSTVARLEGALDLVPAEQISGGGHRITPAVKEVFAAAGYVGVILNRPSNGMRMDLWTARGGFVKSVEVPGPGSGLVDIDSIGAGKFRVTNLLNGAAAKLDIAALAGGE